MPPIVPQRSVATSAMAQPRVSPDAFGAPIGRAAERVGQNLEGIGDRLGEIAIQNRERTLANGVLDVQNRMQDRIRAKLYDPDTGLFSRRGGQAMGGVADYQTFSDNLLSEAEALLPDPQQRDAFRRSFQRQTQATLDSVATHEQRETITYGDETVKATIGNASIDYANAAGNQELMNEAMQRGRDAILVNRAGLPVEALNEQIRTMQSGMVRSAVDQLVAKDPREAQAFYEANRSMVDGEDHIRIQTAIEKPLRAFRVRENTQRIITGGGSAARQMATQGNLVASMAFAESAFDPTAESPVGASGIMQVMPGTAREISTQLGDGLMAGLSDDEIKAALQDPNSPVGLAYGSFYMQQQLTTFQGDIEASLIAYNAGPANARKWLNSGRDYSVLPVREETEPYVQKVMAAYVGNNPVTLRSQGGEVQVEAADSFLLSRLGEGKTEEHITRMQPQLKVGIAGLFNAAPPEIREGLGIYSGYRSVERQAQLYDDALAKYGDESTARRWVAPPGRSQHNHGNAADLSYNGRSLKHAPAHVVKWLHENAATYGLTFPLSNENWHIEAIGARGGGQPGPAESYVVSDGATVSPNSGFAGWDDVSLDDWLSQVDLYAETPEEADAMRRSLTAEYGRRERVVKAQKRQLVSEAFRGILSGDVTVDGLDAGMLQAMDGQDLDRLYRLEERVAKRGEPKQNDAVWYRLQRMSDEDLREVDLYAEYGDQLDRSHLDQIIARQAAIMRDDEAGRAEFSGLRTRTNIVDRALQIMELRPNDRAADAQTAGAFEARVDRELRDYQLRNGREADATEIQRVVDFLLIEGKGGWFSASPGRVFEIEREGAADFTAASTVEDIPADRLDFMARQYFEQEGVPLDMEGDAVELYNSAIQAAIGGNVPIPEDDRRDFAQALAPALGRPLSGPNALTDDELTFHYNRYLAGLVGF